MSDPIRYFCPLLIYCILCDIAYSLAPRKVVVVGGGVGGLALGARIAAATKNDKSTSPTEITIVEKNPIIGGRCGSFNVNVPGYGTFRHERGPSLLLLPHVYEKLFVDCGTLAEHYGLRMVPCNPAYQVFFPDGDTLPVGYRRMREGEMTEDELASRAKMDAFEENGSLKWDAYMHACQAFLNCGLPNFIEEKLDLLSFPAFLLESLRDSAKAWPLKPHSDVLEGFFNSTKMRAMASFQDLYVGLEPYRNEKQLAGGVLGSTAPAVFGLLAAIELHPENKQCGVFAPLGGFESVTKAIKELCNDLGVLILYNHTVTSVSNSGVNVLGPDGESSFVDGDLVVVNADLPYAQRSLVLGDTAGSRSERYDWEDKYRFSSGVISFHWSINKTLDNLNTHNVFLEAGSDAEAMESWNCIREKPYGGRLFSLDGKCNFYVHRPSKEDPTAAPKGCDSVLILLPCSTLMRQESCANMDRASAMKDYASQFGKGAINSAREVILSRLSVVEGLEDLRKHIVDEIVDTPATMADSWNVAAGTPFGLSHGLAQLSRLRPTHLAEFPNAVFVGASCRPGNGVPLVLIGAEQAASSALKHLDRAKS